MDTCERTLYRRAISSVRLPAVRRSPVHNGVLDVNNADLVPY